MSAEDDWTSREGRDLVTEGSPLVASYAADDVALAALARRVEEEPPRCHACDKTISGTPAGSGLLVWSRGDRVETEEPPLCAACAAAIGLSALRRWAIEDDEEG
ncbi:MAG: hypothetical protein FJ095_07630 [Deltaproteobacteria bacterium]|nr:hypothetical protein [Deltaproteobacteria bacterium]